MNDKLPEMTPNGMLLERDTSNSIQIVAADTPTKFLGNEIIGGLDRSRVLSNVNEMISVVTQQGK